MDGESCTPLEVPAVLQLRDHDLAVGCLEVIRLHLRSILPEGVWSRVEVIPLCHHHPSNCYPALGVFGAEAWAEVVDADSRINAWVSSRGLDWLVTQSGALVAPSWDSLRAGVECRTARTANRLE
jgi:hypothetical protein